MHKVDWTALALADLRRIKIWLSDHAPAAAAPRLLRSIGDKANLLLQFPMGGRAIIDRDFRVSPVTGTPYLLIYRVKEDTVQILRVRHERENWSVNP